MTMGVESRGAGVRARTTTDASDLTGVAAVRPHASAWAGGRLADQLSRCLVAAGSAGGSRRAIWRVTAVLPLGMWQPGQPPPLRSTRPSARYHHTHVTGKISTLTRARPHGCPRRRAPDAVSTPSTSQTVTSPATASAAVTRSVCAQPHGKPTRSWVALGPRERLMATGVEQPPGELGSACSIAFHRATWPPQPTRISNRCKRTTGRTHSQSRSRRGHKVGTRH